MLSFSETLSHLDSGSCPITCDCGCVPKSQYCHEGRCYCNSTNLPIEPYLNEDLQLIGKSFDTLMGLIYFSFEKLW